MTAPAPIPAAPAAAPTVVAIAPPTGTALEPLSLNTSNIHTLPKLNGRADYKDWVNRVTLALDIAGANDLMDLIEYGLEEAVPEALLGAWKVK